MRTGIGRRKRGQTTTKLRLTSMMDILVVLLLFLLKSFVVEGEAMTPPPGLELPQSTSQDLPDVSVHIAILDQGILVGDQLVSTPKEVAENDWVLPGLSAKLDEIRKQSEEIRKLKGVDAPESQRATVQGDKDLQFEVVEKVMFTLADAGFTDISLAVIKKH